MVMEDSEMLIVKAAEVLMEGLEVSLVRAAEMSTKTEAEAEVL